MIGVMELALQEYEGGAEYRQQSFEETGLPEFQRMALRRPLIERRFRSARATFDELRQSALSASTRRLWQSFLLPSEDDDTLEP